MRAGHSRLHSALLRKSDPCLGTTRDWDMAEMPRSPRSRSCPHIGTASKEGEVGSLVSHYLHLRRQALTHHLPCPSSPLSVAAPLHLMAYRPSLMLSLTCSLSRSLTLTHACHDSPPAAAFRARIPRRVSAPGAAALSRRGAGAFPALLSGKSLPGATRGTGEILAACFRTQSQLPSARALGCHTDRHPTPGPNPRPAPSYRDLSPARAS